MRVWGGEEEEEEVGVMGGGEVGVCREGKEGDPGGNGPWLAEVGN